MFGRYLLAFGVLVVASSLASCGGDTGKGPFWSQSHADAANSGQLLFGSKPAVETGLQKLSIGAVAYSSPVVSPDGTVYLATFNAAPGTPGNELLAVTLSPTLSIKARWPLGGQLSTPAVDGAGNIYVAQYFDATTTSHLLSLTPTGQVRFNIQLTGSATALSAPKILQTNIGTLIFQTYIGGIPLGGHVLVVDDQGKHPYDQWTCGKVEGGYHGGGFHVPGVNLGPPYPEDAAIGLRVIPSHGALFTYAVAAVAHCGIIFYRLDLGAALPASAAWFHTIASKDTSAAYFSSPAISVEGIAVIADSDQKVTGYDVVSGKQKWQYKSAAFVSTTPAFIPLGLNTVYVASYNMLTSLDVDTGQNKGEIGLVGPVDAALIVSGNDIFVSTYSGIFTYDLNLTQLAFTALSGGRSSPAIGPAGQILVADSAGSFFVFPGP